MESPLILIIEHFIKSSLKDYIKDSLILDSFSIFDKEFSLKNIKLKPIKKTINKLPIEILSGAIDSIYCECSILEKSLKIDLSSITLSVLLPDISELIYPSPKSKKITVDPCKKYSFQTNQINSLYSSLSQFLSVQWTISNININWFAVIDDHFIGFFINLGKFKNNIKANENCINDIDAHIIGNFIFTDLNTSVCVVEIQKESSIYDIIKKGFKNNIQLCQVIEQTNIQWNIKSSKYRFERNSYIKGDTNPGDMREYNEYTEYSKFDSFKKNNEITLDINKNIINISNSLLLNTITILHNIKVNKKNKLDLRISGQLKLRRQITKMKQIHRENKAKGYRFHTPKLELSRMYLSIIKHWTYIALIMKQKKIIDFDLNFYACEKLVSEYKNKVIKEDHFIFDYLIEENIKNFTECPSIAGSNSFFLNWDIFSSWKSPTQNKTLKSFMLFILTKFTICKQCIENYLSYDDFYFLNFNFEKIRIYLRRDIDANVETMSPKDNDIISLENKYLNDLELAVRCSKNKYYNKVNQESSNIWMYLDIMKCEFKWYSNFNEHFLLKSKTLSAVWNDISYLTVENNKSIPLFRSEYEIYFSLFIINNIRAKCEICLPNILITWNPFNVYFWYLYLHNIWHKYRLFRYKLRTTKMKFELESATDWIQNEDMKKRTYSKEDLKGSNNTQTELKDYRGLFKSFKITVNHIVIIIGYSTGFPTEQSLALQISNIAFLSNEVKFNLSLEEITFGSIWNKDYVDYFNYTKCLNLKTNIFNIFDIQQEMNLPNLLKHEKHNIIIPLKDIIIELNKKDVDNMFITYKKFKKIANYFPKVKINTYEQYWESITKEKRQQTVKIEKKVKKKNQFKSWFLVQIEKIIIHVNWYDKNGNENGNTQFKHIIVIINTMQLMHFRHNQTMIDLALISKITAFHKYNTTWKLFETISFAPKGEDSEESNLKIEGLLNGDEIGKVVEVLQENNWGILVEKLKEMFDMFYLKNVTFDREWDQLSKGNNTRQVNDDTQCSTNIHIQFPKIYYCFDYLLTNTFKQFSNYDSNTYWTTFDLCFNNEIEISPFEIYEGITNLVSVVSATPVWKSPPINKTLALKVKKDIHRTFIQIDQIEVDFLEKQKQFLIVNWTSFEASYEKKVFNIKSVIKNVIDNRIISSKKKHIITKNSMNQLLFSLKLCFSKKICEWRFENARVVYLNRIVLDWVEYFYKMIYLDLIESFNYQKQFDSSKSWQERVKTANEMNNCLIRINDEIHKKQENVNHNKKDFIYRRSLRRMTYHLFKSSANPINQMNFNSNNSINHSNVKSFGNRLVPNLVNIKQWRQMRDKDSTGFKVTIIWKNTEVLCCMNSLKDEEWIVESPDIEFSTYVDDNWQNSFYTYYTSIKDSFNISENKRIDLTWVDYYCSIKKIKIKKIIERNTKDNKIKSIEVATFSTVNRTSNNLNPSTEDWINDPDSKLSNLLILFSSNNYEEILSSLNIIVLAPFMKIKMYTDIYEELLRVIFENLGEAQSIISAQTQFERNYYNTQDFSSIDQELLKFITFQQILVYIKDCTWAWYNYPSKCLNHKSDKKIIKQHETNIDCDFGKKYSNIELDKFCEIKWNDLYIVMKFLLNKDKFLYTTFTNIRIELNKNLSAFKNYPNYNWLIINDITKRVCFDMELSMLYNQPIQYDIKLYQMQLLYLPLPLTALFRYFSKYFFYYQNKKIKNVETIDINPNNIQRKEVNIYIYNSELYCKGIVVEAPQQMSYDIKFDFNWYIKMKTDGNTILGPFTSHNEYQLHIKNGYINSKIINPNGSVKSFGQSQFLDRVKIIISQFSQCDHKWQDKDRYCYYYIKYDNNDTDVLFWEAEKNINNIVNVTKDRPKDYRDFISNFKFKEEDEILISDDEDINLQQGKENNNNEEENINWLNNNNINNSQQEENIKLAIADSSLSSYRQRNLKKNINTIKVSLNWNQINHITKIFSSINADYWENAKYALGNLVIATQFSTITYKTSYSWYLSEIEMIICDSQFNAQIFQIILSKIMLIYTNNPDNTVINAGLNKLMMKYNYANNIKRNNIEFEVELLLKFIFKVNYHNSNQSKKKGGINDKNNNNNTLDNINNNQHFLEENSNWIEENEYWNKSKDKKEPNFWEPFIEPLPGKFSYWANNNETYTKFDILSMKQTYDGIKRICRQRKYHSLNININERLLDSFNALLTDYELTKELENKKESDINNGENQWENKKLTILNLTEYYMHIDKTSNSNFYDIEKDNEEKTYTNILEDENESNYSPKNNSDNIINTNIRYKSQSNRNINAYNNISGNSINNNFNYNYNNNGSKTRYYFRYQELKKINNKDEIYVRFQSTPFNSNNNIYVNYSMTNQSKFTKSNSTAPMRKGTSTHNIYNIERPTKFFYIHNEDKNEKKIGINSNTQTKNDLNKLIDNFRENKSLLWPGEKLLVCEVKINNQGTEKLVTFRSNEGIKNELDFPVKIKFNLKEKMKKSDLTIVLYPGKYFFIPPIYWNNIKEIFIKPAMKVNECLKFSNYVYPYNEISFIKNTIDENEPTTIICSCKVKTIYVYEDQKKQGQETPFPKKSRLSPKISNIVFAIVKKDEIIEKEFLDNKIKNKIQFINDYENYIYQQDKTNYENSNIFDVSKAICDVVYVLTPIMKFYNGLPKTLNLHKQLPLPDWTKPKKNKKNNKPINIPNNFDVEKYLKWLAIENQNYNVDKCEDNIQGQYAELTECNYENYKMAKGRIINMEDDIISIPPGDYLSIYEPYMWTINDQKDLHYWIEIHNPTDENYNTILFKPFSFKVFSKSIGKFNDYDIISFPKIIKSNTKNIKSKTRSYFWNTLEVNENHLINSYFYCPYLFINCSDMNLVIKYKNYKKVLFCSSNEKKENYIEKVEMFNPTSRNGFSFDLTKVTINKDKPKEKSWESIEEHWDEIELKIMGENSKAGNNVDHLGSQNGNRGEWPTKNDEEDTFKQQGMIIPNVPSNRTLTDGQRDDDQSHSEESSGKNKTIQSNNILMIDSTEVKHKKTMKIKKKYTYDAQWKKIRIWDISKFGGITVDLPNKHKRNHVTEETGEYLLKDGNLFNSNNNNNPNISIQSIQRQRKKCISMPSFKLEQKLTFSLQMTQLPKYVNLIYITTSIIIVNHTQKDIYIYHLPCLKHLFIKSSVLKAMSDTKFHYLNDYYPYVQLSFEDKYQNNNRSNFSGLINFTLEELKNKEFFVSLGDPRKEPLWVIKVYEEKGFKFVIITQNENVNQYPFIIVNKLNIPVSFMQKENWDDKNNEINNIYTKWESELGIHKRIGPHYLKEFVSAPESTRKTSFKDLNSNWYLNHNHSLMNQENNITNNISNTDNKMYYTWEEPLLYDKEKSTNIWEIKLSGAKFEIDPQEIQKDIWFTNKVELTSPKMYIANTIDSPVLSGKIRIRDKKHEYLYELYKHALILKCIGNLDEIILFEFQDKNLTWTREYNGDFTMKFGMKDFKLFCVNIEETNKLVEKINVYAKLARDFSNNFVIWKYAKNKCIFIEITTKENVSNNTKAKKKSHLFFNVENLGISFILKHNEFMYIWMKNVYHYIEQEYDSENGTRYNQIILKIQDYQIDNYAKDLYYPVILSPLRDKSNDIEFSDYFNILLVINNLQLAEDLYQVDLIYWNICPIDLKFENQFLENLNSFILRARMCFNSRKKKQNKTVYDYINDIDTSKYIEKHNIMGKNNESRLHVKQFCIDDIKICFSLKFDNIGFFLETSSFIFLKPLIEELGLRILNLDSAIFAFGNYTKTNIYQSTNDFLHMVGSFLFQQFISEWVRALGGISSINSMQFVENWNNNFFGQDEKSWLEQYRTKKGFKEMYLTGYENISTFVGGIFMLAYKIFATWGRFLAILTLDEKYKKNRTYIINTNVKSLCHGLSISLDLLMTALYYTVVQFYTVPKRMMKQFHWTFVILFSWFIIIIGCFWKPICGIFDLFTKSLETVGVSINDILADRVKMYARFPRQIKDNILSEYNSMNSWAAFAKKCIDKAHNQAKTEDICIAVPGLIGSKWILVLLTWDRLMVVEYQGEFNFKEVISIHFSSIDWYKEEIINDEKKEMVLDTKEQYVWFSTRKMKRKIEINWTKNKACSINKGILKIDLFRWNNDNWITRKYDCFIKEIIQKQAK